MCFDLVARVVWFGVFVCSYSGLLWLRVGCRVLRVVASGLACLRVVASGLACLLVV